jgi:hypothetical protein
MLSRASSRAFTPSVSLQEKYALLAKSPHSQMVDTMNTNSVEPGKTTIFSSGGYAYIPEVIPDIVLKTNKGSTRILILGDGRAADAFSVRVHQLAKLLPESQQQSLSDEFSRFDQAKQTVVEQATIQRIDLHDYSEREQNQAFRTQPSWGTGQTTHMQKLKQDFFFSLSGDREAQLGPLIKQDLRSKHPLPPSDIVTLGQLTHYFSTNPPTHIDPQISIPISARTEFLKKVAAGKPAFIIFDDAQPFEGSKKGIEATLLAEGYVADKDVNKKYSAASEIVSKRNGRTETKTVNIIYRYDPEFAQKNLTINANKIKKVWKKGDLSIKS